jgi:hypothetical protein
MTDQQQHYGDNTMSTNEHPITPPPELCDKWIGDDSTSLREDLVRAAQWGADMELEAVKAIAKEKGVSWFAVELQQERRPKSPSLKKRIAAAITDGDERTALLLLNEALPND